MDHIISQGFTRTVDGAAARNRYRWKKEDVTYSPPGWDAVIRDIPLYAVSKLLGHTNAKHTGRYSQPNTSDLRKSQRRARVAGVWVQKTCNSLHEDST